DRVWFRKMITKCLCQAAMISAMVWGGRSSRRSTPEISAPSAGDSGFTVRVLVKSFAARMVFMADPLSRGQSTLPARLFRRLRRTCRYGGRHHADTRRFVHERVADVMPHLLPALDCEWEHSVLASPVIALRPQFFHLLLHLLLCQAFADHRLRN